MTTQELDIDILRRYLLADLDEKEDVSVSQQLLADRWGEELLLAAEDELIDEWVRGELSSVERSLFHENFLPTEHRRIRSVFSAALESHLSKTPLPTPATDETDETREKKPIWDFKSWFSWIWDWSPAPVWSYALAGLLLIAVIGGVWALTGKLRLENQLDQQTADLARLGDRATATVWLSPGLLRGLGEVERLIIPPDSSLVRVQLDIGVDDYGSYRAALNDADGGEIWTQSKLTATSAGDKVAVTVIFPTELLASGDYYIRLSGVSSSGDFELVGRYYFRALGG